MSPAREMRAMQPERELATEKAAHANEHTLEQEIAAPSAQVDAVLLLSFVFPVQFFPSAIKEGSRFALNA